MSTKFEGGASTALLLVDSLTIDVGEMQLTSSQPFPLHITLEYWPYVCGDWEEPPSPEYLLLEDARVLAPLYFTNTRGLTTSVDARMNFLELLNDSQEDAMCKALLAARGDAEFNTCSVIL